MIKGVFARGGRMHLMIGLSAENCKRLLDGQPITFDVSEIPAVFTVMPSIKLLDTRVVVIGGADEQTMMDDIRREMSSTGPKS